MSRLKLLQELDQITEKECKDCQVYEDNAKNDDRNLTKTNKYCTNECEVGKKIQGIGDQLLKELY